MQVTEYELIPEIKEFKIPFSGAIELNVISIVLFYEKYQDEFFNTLKSEDYFFNVNTRKIYNIMAKLRSDNKPVVYDKIASDLFISGDNQLGTFMLDLGDKTLLDHHFKDYLKELQELYIKRELIFQSLKTIDNVNSSDNLKGLMNENQERFTDLALLSDPDQKTQKELILGVAEYARQTQEPDFNLKKFALSTGFPSLDQLILGWQNKLYIVAARPAMGKTSLVLNSAVEVAKTGKPVLFVSGEMPREEVLQKVICTDLGVSTYHFQQGLWTRYVSQIQIDLKCNEILQLPFYVVDDIFTVSGIRAKAKEIKKETGQYPLLVIDYLQLMDNDNSKKNSNRVEDVSAISRGLKRLQVELSTPVIALSQLSRTLEQRQNKRPMMSDLRESGQLEQDADLIIFIYRDGYYTNDTMNKDAEIIISKHRGGPLGTVELFFDAPITKFKEKGI